MSLSLSKRPSSMVRGPLNMAMAAMQSRDATVRQLANLDGANSTMGRKTKMETMKSMPEAMSIQKPACQRCA